MVPLLENYPELKIIAVDISPDLLVILNREAAKRSIDSRCLTVAMDAQRDYFVEGFADYVFGGAVLHHMVSPEKVVRTALRLLKPGGHAIFFEPFENGHFALRWAYQQILAEAQRRGESGPGFNFLDALREDIRVRTHRQETPGFDQLWAQLDDKWMFTRKYFERMAEEVGAKGVYIQPLHALEAPFTTQTRVALTAYAGLKCPESLPVWAWEILDDLDKMLSTDLKEELLIEGSIVFER